MKHKIYRGIGRPTTADEPVEVYVDGKPLDPKPSQKVWNHSPDGFNWGYEGSGPAQLALALLLDFGLSSRRAIELHQEFKQKYVARWPIDQDWILRSQDIEEFWLKADRRDAEIDDKDPA